MNRYDRFTNLILNVSRNIQKIKNYEMASLGLKGNQVQCLYYLYNLTEGASASELNILCNEDKAASSRTIKSLEEKGYLYVDKSNDKKYKNPVKLTEKGKDIAKLVCEQIDSIVLESGKELDENNRIIFYEALELINKNLNEICQKHNYK